MGLERPGDDGQTASVVLLEATRQGNAEALTSLLERHLPMLRAFVRLQISPALRIRESESDLVQSVCVEVLRRADRFDNRGEAAFRSWLFKAVLNEIRDHERYWRTVKRAPEHCAVPHGTDALATVYHTLTPSRSAMAIEDIQRVEAAFARMPQDQARALALTRFVGLDLAGAAQELGRSVGATQQLVRRAQVRLSRLLLVDPATDDA